MSAAEVLREMESQGVVLCLVGDRIKARGDARIIAKYSPFIKGNRPSVIKCLARGRPPALSQWSWLPERCPGGECWNAWDCARILRDLCDSFSLHRLEGRFILVPMRPLTPRSARNFGECIDYLLVEAADYLGKHAGHFPVLTASRARTCLSMLDRYHRGERAKAIDMRGMSLPDYFPWAVKVTIQTIYITWVVGEEEARCRSVTWKQPIHV